MIPLLHDSREREREKQKGNRSDLVDRRHIERWRLTSGRFQENACKSAASKVHYLSRCGTARAKTECIINSKREARPMLNEVRGQCGALARKSILTRRCSIPDATGLLPVSNPLSAVFRFSISYRIARREKSFPNFPSRVDRRNRSAITNFQARSVRFFINFHSATVIAKFR